MTAGRKPPIMPPRNPLAARGTANIGKRPHLSYAQAMEKRRERQRLEKTTAPKVPGVSALIGVFLPNRNPREAARLLMTGTNKRAEQKAQRKADEARARMEDDMRRAGFDGDVVAFTAANDVTQPGAEAPTNRPPRRDSGRYDGLKDG